MDVPGSQNGVWQSCTCVNAETEVFHTEQDCTYTVVSIPNQSKEIVKEVSKDHNYHFLFKVRDKCLIGIPLEAGVTFLFSGNLLTHRQHCRQTTSVEENSVFNFASYGNKNLCNNLKQSLLCK